MTSPLRGGAGVHTSSSTGGTPPGEQVIVGSGVGGGPSFRFAQWTRMPPRPAAYSCGLPRSEVVGLELGPQPAGHPGPDHPDTATSLNNQHPQPSLPLPGARSRALGWREALHRHLGDRFPGRGNAQLLSEVAADQAGRGRRSRSRRPSAQRSSSSSSMPRLGSMRACWTARGPSGSCGSWPSSRTGWRPWPPCRAAVDTDHMKLGSTRSKPGMPVHHHPHPPG
jgi:hypothetical protein